MERARSCGKEVGSSATPGSHGHLTSVPPPRAHHKWVVWQAPAISPGTKTRLKSQGYPKPLPGMTLFPWHSVEPPDSHGREEGRNQTLRFSVPLPKTPAQPQRELFTPLSRAWTDYLLVINLLRFHRHTFAGRFPTHISGRRGSQRHILTHAKALWWIRGSSIHPSTLSKTVPNIPFHTWSIMNVPFLMHVQYCTFTHWQRSSLNY